MSNLIRIGGGGGSAPTLIAKSITENGTYNAIDDNADGYSSVEVDVEGGGEESVIGEVIMLISNNPFVQNTGITGTDVANVSRSWTFDRAGIIKFADTTYGRTNTSSNDGFYDIQLNGVSVAKQYLTSNVDTSITVDDIPVSVGDTLDIVYGFDNYHSRCDFTFYGAISLVTLIPKYVDLSSFAYYYKRNTTTPTVTPISATEVSLSFQDQNATGYELCSFGVSLEKGTYVAEIKATVDKNTGLANQYTWGIYSANTTGGAQENSADVKSKGYTTYVPFDRSDTAEHTYEVPINVTADGTAYICFAMADDNGVNATVTVSSLKIRKAYGVESGGISFNTILTAGVISNDQDYQTATFENSIGTNDNYLLMRMLKDGTYRYMYLSKSDIPASGEYSFAFSDVQCSISQTAIRATYYSGNWRYIYVDIVGSSELIFPQTE